MFKKLVSLVLCMVLIVGIMPISANATDSVTVTVSFGVYGKLCEDRYGEVIANREITLSGKDSYTANDAILALHKLYCPDGEAGYGTGTSDWGLYITKLWGDTSGNFGYQVNGGSVYTTLDTPMGNGDSLDVCIYQSYYPDTENYTTFDKSFATATEGEGVTLTLTVAGYDDNYNMVFSPLEGATITIDGKETAIITDEYGEAEISLSQAGKHVISATMTKELEIKDENGDVISTETVPAIAAPACTLTVKERPENALIHGIAAKYLEGELLNSGTNFPWIVSDLAVYSELYPEKAGKFNESLRQKCLDNLIANALTMETPGDLAKTIIAISALGYDASVVYTSSGGELKLTQKLLDLVNAKDSAVTNMYTLPYVIIALNEGEYASGEQMEYLIKSALSTKDDWCATEDMGTDALTPMLLALAPYYNDAEVKSALDQAIEILKNEQREDGLINGFPGYEGASTALAICGLSALNIDAAKVTNGGKNLIEGLISDANEDLTALSNAFATEQGFRALLSYKMLGERMYDFSNYPKETAYATRVSVGGGGGGGSTSKPKEEPEVEPEEEVKEEAPVEQVKETFPDVKETDWYYNAVNFVCEKGLFNGTANGFEPGGNMTRAMLVTVLYRLGGEQVDAECAFTDVKDGVWYYDAVNWASNSGIVNGVDASTFAPDASVTREQLATILYRFAKSKGEDVNGGDLSAFNDAAEVSAYAKDAFSYATAKGIITGKGESTLAPRATATRAEVATMLMRYMVNE